MKKGIPNMIIFLTDDQGYGDLSCMGNTGRTVTRTVAIIARAFKYSSESVLKSLKKQHG